MNGEQSPRVFAIIAEPRARTRRWALRANCRGSAWTCTSTAVMNRWGYVQTRTPEQTMAALQEKLPRRYWIEINALLVPFGKHVCTGSRPKCSTCPLRSMCPQVGVAPHR